MTHQTTGECSHDWGEPFDMPEIGWSHVRECADCGALRREKEGCVMDEKRLTEIRERAEAATEGPWRSHDFGHAGEEEPSSIVVHTGKFDHSDLLTYDTETAVAWMPRWDRQESDNATFIAHARTDVPDLLAEVKRLTAENARLRADVRSLQRGSQRNADAHMVTHRENARLRAELEALRGDGEAT